MITVFQTSIRLIVAFILGGVIGIERERKGRSAGLRTHILVCVGSCLIMLVSIQLFDYFKDIAPVDPGRIAAGVVTGIGFLGAGTIINRPEGAQGLTTAASVWISAAIGMAVGCGYMSAALISTVIAFLTLSFLKRIESNID
jgi:putative Mg2+ transporter-C (MgtC) family protein